MKLLLVRHGETQLNAKGLIQGSLDSPLSDLGQKQVAALAERLRPEKFSQIFSSDLGRAQATAEAIAAYHSQPIQTSELIRERNFGKLEGGAWGMLGILTQQLHVAPYEFIPPEGDSFDMVRARCRQFIDRYLPLESKETILVVAHGGTNRCLLAELLDLTNKFMVDIKQGNCCINIIDITNGSLEYLVINDIEHTIATHELTPGT